MRNDERRSELASVANHHHLRNEAARLNETFQTLGRNIFSATRLQKVFLAIGYYEKPVSVDVADVPCSKPAIIGERGVIIGCAAITLHHGVTLHQDFAVKSDADANTIDDRTDRADSVPRFRVARHRWRGLGPTVPLKNRHSRGKKLISDFGCQRSAARYQSANVP